MATNPFSLRSPFFNSDTERQRRYLEEQAKERERQAILQAEEDAAANEQYALDVFAADQNVRDRNAAQTREMIDKSRGSVVRLAADPNGTVPKLNRYLSPAEAEVYAPILAGEEPDEEVVSAESPLAYVTTGEIYSDPSTPAPAAAATSSGSNRFWDFLGLEDREARNRFGNGMLRAGGAMLAANSPAWNEALGKGITAYADGTDAYDEAQRTNAIRDQQIDLNREKIAQAKRTESVQNEIAKILADAGPAGPSATDRQRIAQLYAGIGDVAGAQAAMTMGQAKPTNYQKGEAYYAPDGSLYTSVFDPNTGKTIIQDSLGNPVTDQSVIQTLRIDDKKRGGGGVGVDLTKGEEKRDETFGTNYEQNAADYNRNQVQLAQLEDAMVLMESNPGVSGNIIVENLPNFLKPYANTDGTIARERIYEVVQGSLRQILGAQFTQQEGELIMERAFNPNLPVEENIKRVRALAEMLRANSAMDKAKLDYFDTNGTLKGFKGNYLSANDVNANVFGDSGNTRTGVANANAPLRSR